MNIDKVGLDIFFGDEIKRIMLNEYLFVLNDEKCMKMK